MRYLCDMGFTIYQLWFKECLESHYLMKDAKPSLLQKQLSHHRQTKNQEVGNFQWRMVNVLARFE